MDHDCVPREGWLENLIKPIVSGRAVAVGGAILTYKGNNVFSKFSDFMKALREPVKDEKGKIIIIITANAAFSKDVFEEVGGFDQRFNKAGGEDLDLTYKLSQAGYIDRLFYEPLAMLEHEHRSDMKGFLRQQFNYGFWDMYHFLLRNRNPEILWVSFPTPINILRYIWDTTLYSFALIDKIPKSYGLLTKYFTFPLISFLRRMAVMSGGIKCYYFHRPLTSNS
jgi:GT2 family glycosyltransferase